MLNAATANPGRHLAATTREPTSSDDAVKDGLVDVFGGRRAVPALVLELELALEQAELGAERDRQQGGRAVPADAQLVGDEPRQRAAQRSNRCPPLRRQRTVTVIQRTDARHSQIPAITAYSIGLLRPDTGRIFERLGRSVERGMGGIPLSSSLGDLWERRKLPHRSTRRIPAEKRIWRLEPSDLDIWHAALAFSKLSEKWKTIKTIIL